ncbi:DMT family transporter [Bordetella bronchiseptica]|nr:DMT family transporter [Bordetella bronchiseptica]AWP73898.1 EamA family transporter [Bordetella bronchiseptica]AZW20710.1 EamA/RhaT family transporter [Bordetella bronchiseptica]KAB1447134.1 DMT family transporter [Bordetella bronchiseptica]KAB1573560.1 DMT family transporter [Bordetella bronchiseptica]MCE7075803.1 EamA family transporter [Bordetella bronchiseptica]
MTDMNPVGPKAGGESGGLLMGLVAVAIFAMSLPMTRLAVGDTSAPQLSPVFVTCARAALAGLLSILYLLAIRSPLPPRRVRMSLFASGMGTVVGFPLFLALALRYVDAMQAAVFTGVLPLATAVFGAILFRQRPSAAFWLCAVAGCALVLAFALYRGNGQVGYGDLMLLAAVIVGAIGYVTGAKASAAMSAGEVISWILAVTFLPMLAVSLAYWPADTVSWQAWGGVGYLGVFPMWIGFFIWYRAMTVGGAVRVSQVQLLQPFLALLFAVPIVGESLDGLTIAFSLAIIAIVYLGKRARVN